MAMALPRSPARTPRRLPKLLVGLAVFATVTGAYATMIHHRATDEAAQRLPDGDRPTGRCSLWFVGSSTIARWQTLSRDMAPWDAHRRGVEGAVLPQLTRWFGNDPAGPRPAAIILYGGENDIAGGASADDTIRAYRHFIAAKVARFGALPVIALSLKPSPTRWSNLPDQTRFNRWLSRYALERHDLSLVDIRPLLLVDRRPGPFYADDGIHLNPAGYTRWTTAIRTRIGQMLPPETVRACLTPDHR